MAPYVYSLGSTPEDGILGFLETPRYSTGYAALFGTIGFTTEAHMLKPFSDRVQATRAFLQVLADWIQGNSEMLTNLRKKEQGRIAAANMLPVRWELSEQRDSLEFEGYTARREWSSVTQGTRLRYDRTNVWQKSIPYANRYDASVLEQVPPAWVIPQAWRQVVSRLQSNEVSMEPIERDTVMLLEVTWIETFSSSSRPYEGHHPISVDSVRTEVQPVQLYRGDWVVPSDQRAKRYLTEVLSPLAHDAFLHWNFFDAALQQKEYFSSYVFEDLAADLLASDEDLRLDYDEARQRHPEWGESPRTALQWIYERVRITKELPTVIQCIELWAKETDLLKSCLHPTHPQTHGSLIIGDQNPRGSKVPTMRQGYFDEMWPKPRRNRFGMPSKWRRA